MTKKFFTVNLSQTKYRVFLDDLNLIIKRTRKIRPSVPRFYENAKMADRQSML